MPTATCVTRSVTVISAPRPGPAEFFGTTKIASISRDSNPIKLSVPNPPRPLFTDAERETIIAKGLAAVEAAKTAAAELEAFDMAREAALRRQPAVEDTNLDKDKAP